MKMEQWIDLSMTISEDFQGYPGDTPMWYFQKNTIEKHGYSLKRVETGMHIGTHMDAKSHVFQDAPGIDQIDINQLIGKAEVIRPILINNIIQTKSIQEQFLGQAKILLLDLGWEEKPYNEYYQYPKFEKGIVSFFVEKGIQVIGMNIPSPEYHEGDMMTMHIDLMTNDIIIVENLIHLSQLNHLVDFIALPLKIKNLDGSMVRAVAKNS